MNTTFKKTLVASAILAFAGAANAATVNQTAVDFSKQGVAAATNVAAGNVLVLLNAEYAVGDTLTFTFPGATFAAASAPVLAGLDGTIAGNVTAANALSTTDATYTVHDGFPLAALELSKLDAGITFGFLSSTTNSVTFRVTELNQTTVPTTIRGLIQLSGVQFAASSVAASNAIDIMYTASTSTGVAIDAATSSSGKLVAVKDQFGLTINTAADAIIDVADDRLTFTGAAVTDTFSVTATNPGVAYELPLTVAPEGVTYTVTGDFSWVDANANGTVTTAELEAAIDGLTVAADTLKIASTLDSISFTGTIAEARPVTFTLPLTSGKAKVAIKPTDFNVTAVVTDSDDAKSTYIKAGGEWELNGSQVRVPYMVVGGSRFGIIANVTNHGSKDGAITLDIFAEDGSVIASNYPAGTSKAGSVTSVAPALLAAMGGSPATATKFSFQITTNVPEKDVIVYAAYSDNTTSERAIVNNDSKVQTK